MKRLAVLALILLLSAQFAAAAEYFGTFDGARAKADSLGKPLLVEFFAVW